MDAHGTDLDASTAALDRWRDDLAAWAIPGEMVRAAGDRSPWELPRHMLADRARRTLEDPSGVSYRTALDALPRGGTVLDVGCGAGAASLPLASRAGAIVGVDSDAAMLRAFGDLGARTGVAMETVQGRWPDVAPTVEPADVVVCHNVLYNVGELEPFAIQLTSHARRIVVIEVTARHPMSDLNPLWLRLHGLVRPERPRADDAITALRALGLPVRAQAWTRPVTAQFGSYQDMLEVTARRLCLPQGRLPELDEALRELGVDPDEPRLESAMRNVVTIWWPPAHHL